MKPTTCKGCGSGPFYWHASYSPNGKEIWLMLDERGVAHDCPVRQVKEVACMYCNANDLWWSKETMEDGTKKNVLMESYGIPHGCEERKAHWEAKKEEYAKEKARINAIPDGGICPMCGGSGSVPVSNNGIFGSGDCWTCNGRGKVTASIKKEVLAALRQRIWPNIGRGVKG